MKNTKSAFSLIEISVVIIIIGILFAATGQGGRMVEKYRLQAAQTQTQSSPVAGIKGLLAWWETTSDLSLLTSESNDQAQVSAWYDINPQSIAKFTVSQSAGANKPIYTAKAINNLPALKFDGSASYFEAVFNADLNPQNITIFAAVKTSSVANYGAIVSSRNDPPSVGYIIYSTPGSFYQPWIGNGSNWGLTPPSSSVALNTTSVLSVIHDGTNVNIYKNGVSAGAVAQAMLLNASKPFRIGAGKNESTTPDYFYNGYIGEVIIFNRVLNNEERRAVEAYLGKKWGVAVS